MRNFNKVMGSGLASAVLLGSSACSSLEIKPAEQLSAQEQKAINVTKKIIEDICTEESVLLVGNPGALSTYDVDPHPYERINRLMAKYEKRYQSLRDQTQEVIEDKPELLDEKMASVEELPEDTIGITRLCDETGFNPS